MRITFQYFGFNLKETKRLVSHWTQYPSFLCFFNSITKVATKTQTFTKVCITKMADVFLNKRTEITQYVQNIKHFLSYWNTFSLSLLKRNILDFPFRIMDRNFNSETFTPNNRAFHVTKDFGYSYTQWDTFIWQI